MKKPLVSVVVPCYNHGRFLEDTIQSVQKSTWKSIEIIIVNDGSVDDSEDVAKKLVNQHENIQYLYQQNAGPSVARNYGISEARGGLILPLDADDLISPDYIVAAVKEFINDPNLKLVYCEAEKFGAKSGKWKLEDFSLEELAYKNMIFVSALFKKTDWQKAEGFAERKKTVDFINKKHRDFIYTQLGGPLRHQKSLSKFINRFQMK